MRSLGNNHTTEKPQNTAGPAEDPGVAAIYARQHRTRLARVGDSL